MERMVRSRHVSDGSWAQTIPLDEFIQGALTGRLRFAPLLGATVPIHVYAAEQPCWKCKRETWALMHFQIAATRFFQSTGQRHVRP